MNAKKCPVCSWEIQEGAAVVVRVGSKEITTCCEACAQEVRAKPEKFAERP